MKGTFKIEFYLEWEKSISQDLDFKIVDVIQDRTKAVRNMFDANGVDYLEFKKRFIKKVNAIK